MAQPLQPEPKFFLIDELFEKGITHYLETWFSGLPTSGVAGEKSTNYLENSVAAERIHDALPEVKLIFLLREPADRAFSNWRWSRMNGLETLGFAEAIRAEPARESSYSPELKYSRPFSYYSRGLYRRMLDPYWKLFRRDKVLCLRYEDITIDPWKLTATVHEFLDVTLQASDAEGVGTVNPADDAMSDIETLDMLKRMYREPNRELADLLGPSFEIWNP
jgi:hypothetical protein